MSKSADRTPGNTHPETLPTDANLQEHQYAQYYAYDPHQQPQVPPPQYPHHPAGHQGDQPWDPLPAGHEKEAYVHPTAYQHANIPPPPSAGIQQGYALGAAGGEAPYQPPVVGPGAAPAVPAYYDYTAPQSYGDVHKFKGDGKWATSLCMAPCAEPCLCISAFFCPCCCTYMQRKKLLVEDWSRYRCCAGLFGERCCFGSNCGSCAPFCLAMETIFCLTCAVHGNRYMVMQHYGLEHECCDTVIICCAFILQIISILVGDDSCESIADCIYCIVLSCIVAQNGHQMKVIPYPTRSSMT